MEDKKGDVFAELSYFHLLCKIAKYKCCQIYNPGVITCFCMMQVPHHPQLTSNLSELRNDVPEVQICGVCLSVR